MSNEKEKFKKQEIKNLKKGKGNILSVHIKDYEYWKEKIFRELFLQKAV